MTDDEIKELLRLLAKAEAVARATMARNLADRIGAARDVVARLLGVRG